MEVGEARGGRHWGGAWAVCGWRGAKSSRSHWISGWERVRWSRRRQHYNFSLCNFRLLHLGDANVEIVFAFVEALGRAEVFGVVPVFGVSKLG